MATSVFLLVAVLLLTSPQVLALAQEVLHFFTPAESNSFTLPLKDNRPAAGGGPIVSVAAPSDCQDSLGPLSYRRAMAGAEGAAGFAIRELPSDPGGPVFGAAYVDPSMEAVRITYSCTGCELTITQVHLASDRPTWDSAWGDDPPDAVEQVQVNGYLGEYVQGSFVSRDGQFATWEPDAARQRLRWREGDMLFEIELGGRTEPVEYLGKTALVALAESMR